MKSVNEHTIIYYRRLSLATTNCYSFLNLHADNQTRLNGVKCS